MAYTPFDLTGKVALVTGGNGGIGFGMADAVAAAGAEVSIWGTNAKKNEDAQKRLESRGVKATAHICDVSDPSLVDETMAKVVEEHGRIDACFVNAGVGAGRTYFVNLDDDEWKRIMSVNLDGAFYCLRAAARHMVERSEQGDKGGRLIATSSMSAIVGMANAEAYAGAKGALLSIIQALAVELARNGITANAIVPGQIETPMTRDFYATNEKYRNTIIPRIPMRRWGTGADFGGIAVYLMSDASSYHTGDKFVIDGGFFMA